MFGASPPPGRVAGTKNGPYRYGSFGMRAFDPPPASKFPVAFVYLETTPSPQLLYANATTSCLASRPARIDRRDSATENLHHGFPRFSHDGSRVAYLDVDPNQLTVVQLVTVGVDGSAPHLIRRSADLAVPGGIWAAPPSWTATGEITWYERLDAEASPGSLRLRRAADTERPTVTTLTACAALVEQFEICGPAAAQKVAVVSSPDAWAQSPTGTVSNISVMAIQNGCGDADPITRNVANGSVARDMAISPDGSTIAYVSNVGGSAPPGGGGLAAPVHVYLASTDVVGRLDSVACSLGAQGYDDFGPRWVAGGTKLVWTRTPRAASREELWTADVSDRRCVNARPLIQDPSGARRFLGGANAAVGCSVVRPGDRDAGGLGVAFAGAFGAALLGLRRRRASRRVSG